MDPALRIRLAGGAAGLVNGLFGGGGGMVLLPILSGTTAPRKLYPTCVGIIFPVCLVSAGMSLLTGRVSLLQALPYLAGGLAGGLLGGALYTRVPTLWLRRCFALFLLYAGVNYLL